MYCISTVFPYLFRIISVSFHFWNTTAIATHTLHLTYYTLQYYNITLRRSIQVPAVGVEIITVIIVIDADIMADVPHSDLSLI
jgi:hypothetical protein